MASIINCLKKKIHSGNFSDFEKERILDAAAELGDAGYKGDQAAIRAIEDIISELEEQQASVNGQVLFQRKELYQVEELPDIEEPIADILYREEIKPEDLEYWDQIAGELDREAERILEENYKAEARKAVKDSIKEARKVVNELPAFKSMDEAVKIGGLSASQLANDYGKETLIQLSRKRPGILSYKSTMEPDGFAKDQVYENLDEMIEEWKAVGTKGEEISRVAKDIFTESYEQYVDEARELTYWDDFLEAQAEAAKAVKQDPRYMPRPDRRLKGIIRKLTGQTRAQDAEKTVSEREALKAAMMKAAQAARVAIREGKQEGVVVERERLKALMVRATERRQKSASVKQLRARLKKELKTAAVKKQGGKAQGKFTPEIQDTLNNLRMVSKLTPDEAEKKLLENMQRYENENMPDEVVVENHFLELQAYLDSWQDPDQLQRALDEIKALKEEGRLINELRKFNRQGKDKVNVAGVLNDLGGLPEGIEVKGIGEFTPDNRRERARRFLHTLGKSFVGWDDISDILSFKSKTSKPGESFISKFNDLLGIKNKEKRGMRIALNKIHDDYMQAYGLQSGWAALKQMNKDTSEIILLKKVPLTDQAGQQYETDMKFTKAELRKRAMELMDPSLWETFVAKMNYDERTVARLYGELTPQDREFIRLQMEFYQEYYNGINEVFRVMRGVNLPKNDSYSPIAREGVSKPAEDGMGEFMREINFRAAATSGSLISRVKNIHTLAKQNDLSVLQQHVIEMEHYKAWAEKIRELEAVWKNPDIRAAMEIHHGKDMIAMVDNFIADFATGGMKQGHKLRGIDKFRINFTRAALAVQPDILVKQLTSFIAYADAMPVGTFVKNYALFWKNPIENAKLILGSEMMKERGQHMERDIKQAMQSEEYSQFSQHNTLLNMLLLNVQIGDQGAIVMGGWAYYKYLRDQGLHHEEAIYKFEKFSEQTQQSGDITEQSYWQRGGSLAKLFTMFTSSPNQYLRKEIAAIRNLAAGRQSWGKTGKTILIYHVVLPLFFQLASDRFDWDLDEDLRAVIYGPLNGFFIVGDAIDWLLRKKMGMQAFDMELPIFSVAHDLYNAMSLADLDDLSAEDFFRAIRGLAGAAGAYFGIPLKQAVDIGKGGVDVLNGEYEKGLTEMMGYSPYKAEELAND